MPPEYIKYEDWFSAYVLPHEPLLRAWLKNRFAESNDIDDLIQEAYLRVLRAKTRYELKSPKAFLFATARNLALDAVRHSKVIRFDSFAKNDWSEVLEEGEDVHEVVARNQELELLTKAIQSLPAKCRRIFTLRKVYCMPPPEIAKKLGISLNTVATQLKIGVRKCTAFMEENCDR